MEDSGTAEDLGAPSLQAEFEEIEVQSESASDALEALDSYDRDGVEGSTDHPAEGLLEEHESMDEIEDEEYDHSDDEDDAVVDAAGGAGFGSSGHDGEGMTIYIPGIGNVPLSSLGALSQRFQRNAAPAAIQQDPTEKAWSALDSLPDPTKDAVLELVDAARRRGQRSVTVLLLGAGGVGKSSTVNSLFGERAATVSSFHPTGLKPVAYTRRLPDGFALRLIDTPSVIDQDAASAARLDAIAQAVKVAGGAVDAVLYLDRLDVYETGSFDEQAIDAITAYFGATIWDRAMIGLTRATDQAPPPGYDDFDAWVSRRAEQIGALIDKYCDRYSARPRSGALQRPAPPAAAPPRPVVLIENHSLCPKNEEGESLAPGDVPWITRFFQELAYLVHVATGPAFTPDLAAAAKAADPDRRRKWLIPLVLLAQLGLKLLLDRVMEYDAVVGDEDGPFDPETQRARVAAYKSGKSAQKENAKELKINKAVDAQRLAALLGDGTSKGSQTEAEPAQPEPKAADQPK